MKTTIFKDAFLVDGTGREPVLSCSVVVEGNLIKEILEERLRFIPLNAEVVECQGRTLMPGLIDAHIHIGLVDADLSEQDRMNYSSLIAIKAVKILKETLDQGITTARDAGGADAGYRVAVEKGLIPGPRLKVCGRALSQTGGHGDYRLPTDESPVFNKSSGFNALICDGVEEVRKAAREELRRGADMLKILASGGCATPSDRVDGTSQYSLDEMKTAVFEAESANTYVLAHCYSNRSIRLALKAGVQSIEHGNFMNRETAKMLRDAGAYYVPTLTTYEILGTRGTEFGIPDFFQNKINCVREASLDALANAQKEGVIIGSGTDVIGPGQLYKTMELELKAKVMGPMGAIVSATKTNAQILKMEDKIGTVEEGKFADLILINGNPLEDISIFQKYEEKLMLIMLNGEIYKNTL